LIRDERLDPATAVRRLQAPPAQGAQSPAPRPTGRFGLQHAAPSLSDVLNPEGRRPRGVQP
jgi:hypothetical protein